MKACNNMNPANGTMYIQYFMKKLFSPSPSPPSPPCPPPLAAAPPASPGCRRMRVLEGRSPVRPKESFALDVKVEGTGGRRVGQWVRGVERVREMREE